MRHRTYTSRPKRNPAQRAWDALSALRPSDKPLLLYWVPSRFGIRGWIMEFEVADQDMEQRQGDFYRVHEVFAPSFGLGTPKKED